MQDNIVITGARENNLKNINVEIPRYKLVVFTGVSGSGKSSLAFDTIYAEGQMRYVESLSSYARQFLGLMNKPDIDSIEGLSPAISIEQKTTSQNPRSTVGTVTEIYDYLRLLWARIGIPHCPHCGLEIRKQSVDQIVDQILALPLGTRFQVLAPVIRGKKGEHQKVFASARKNGYVRVRVDGSVYELTENIKLDKNQMHQIEIVVDRLVVKDENIHRLSESIETAVAVSGGLVIIHQPADNAEHLFSQNYTCTECGMSLPELSPRMFSFNSPYGACPTCSGLGYRETQSESAHHEFPFNVRGGRCEACAGDGLIKIGMHFLPDIFVPCDVCKGKRYNRETLEVKYKGKNIADVLEMSAEEAAAFFKNLPKICRKVETLCQVGLGYVKLGQASTTMSGGEAQRVKLAAELLKVSTGSTIYVMDEPTTGLHSADVHQLIDVLQKLVDAGNTVVVIEHNLDVIKTADYLIDLGLEGGSGGGSIICTGTPEQVAACAASYTGQYLKRLLQG